MATVKSEDILYSVYGSSLTAIADQVRRINKTEDPMTLDQMATNLLNVTPLGEYPKAEESAFGVAGDIENGITSYGTGGNISIATLKSYGWKFTAAEAFSIIGFRQKHSNNYEKRMTIWDSSGTAVADIVTSDNAAEWISYYFDNPINVAIGESYTVSVYTKAPYYLAQGECTFNGKLLSIETYMSTGYMKPVGNCGAFIYNIDIIIAPVSAELPNDYQITRNTMDDIAEEVQRITGATDKMTTAQIITALQNLSFTLQSKTATPTTEVQTITPDEGYYGLSSVTVEAAAAVENLQDLSEVPF